MYLQLNPKIKGWEAETRSYFDTYVKIEGKVTTQHDNALSSVRRSLLVMGKNFENLESTVQILWYFVTFRAYFGQLKISKECLFIWKWLENLPRVYLLTFRFLEELFTEWIETLFK